MTAYGHGLGPYLRMHLACLRLFPLLIKSDSVGFVPRLFLFNVGFGIIVC
jgi:hypothetical protein